MEFRKYPDRKAPRRGARTPIREPSPARPVPFREPFARVNIPADLASERTRLGFDDVLEDATAHNVKLRTLLFAWIKQNLRRGTHTPKRKMSTIKDDIAWALQADLDEIPQARPVKTQPTPKKQTDARTIDININLGTLPKLPGFLRSGSFRTVMSRLRRPRAILVICSLITVIGVGMLANYFLSPKTLPGFARTGATGASTVTAGVPDYPTLLPDGKTIADFGGWTRVSPPTSNPVFAYADSIGGIRVTVSQQPLPDSFKSGGDGSQLEELAKNFNATDTLQAGSTTIHIGTSAKGPQSIIFTKNDVLILMKAGARLPENALVAYVESLN